MSRIRSLLVWFRQLEDWQVEMGGAAAFIAAVWILAGIVIALRRY